MGHVGPTGDPAHQRTARRCEGPPQGSRLTSIRWRTCAMWCDVAIARHVDALPIPGAVSEPALSAAVWNSPSPQDHSGGDTSLGSLERMRSQMSKNCRWLRRSVRWPLDTSQYSSAV